MCLVLLTASIVILITYVSSVLQAISTIKVHALAAALEGITTLTLIVCYAVSTVAAVASLAAPFVLMASECRIINVIVPVLILLLFC